MPEISLDSVVFFVVERRIPEMRRDSISGLSIEPRYSVLLIELCGCRFDFLENENFLINGLEMLWNILSPGIRKSEKTSLLLRRFKDLQNDEEEFSNRFPRDGVS